MSDRATDLLVWGVIAHLVADWLLQNNWQATNKVSLRHPAAWVHGGFHFLCQLPVFPFLAIIAITIIHMLVDTRKPLIWWRAIAGQTKDQADPMSRHVAIWGDQVVHAVTLAIVSLICARL